MTLLILGQSNQNHFNFDLNVVCELLESTESKDKSHWKGKRFTTDPIINTLTVLSPSLQIHSV